MRKILLLISVVFFLLFSQSCKKEDEEIPLPPNTIDTLAIGDFHQGGIIFYLDSTKLHGMVCSTTEQSYGSIWGCLPLVVADAKGLKIGTGNQNTEDIISTCSSSNIAARLCSGLVLNEYDDWFLPSKDELNLIHENITAINLAARENGGENIQETNYWTSSSYGTNIAWVQFMGSGGRQLTQKVDDSYHVRAVRAF